MNGILMNIDRVLSAPRPGGLRGFADEAVRQPPLSVTHKPAPPPGGTLHDYFSVGPYWWPDPTKPDGLPWVRRDGEVHPNFYSDAYDRNRVERLAAITPALAIAGIDHQPCANHAATLIRTFFLYPATRMNPNLLYGQSIPGVCSGRGIGLIDTHDMVYVIDAALLLHRQGTMTDADLAGLRDWFGRFLDWILTHPYGIDERQQHNNHGSWLDVQLVAYALFVGRRDLAREVLDAVPTNRIERHIQPDGSQPHELKRTRSFTYSCFNLTALMALAWMGRHVGVDLWKHPLLRKAADFLAAYGDDTSRWPYQELQSHNDRYPTARRLARVMRQAAIAWSDQRYAQLGRSCDTDDPAYAACWPMEGT